MAEQDTDFRGRLHAAIHGSQPARAAYELARELRDHGVGQLELYLIYDDVRAALIEDDAKLDAVLDTMDCIVGWCSVASRLFVTSISNEDIARARGRAT